MTINDRTIALASGAQPALGQPIARKTCNPPEVAMFDDDTSRRFKVVVNDEEQYSIWPEDRDNPAGWHDEGKVGTKEECLEHIERVWTDLRPRSVRVTARRD